MKIVVSNNDEFIDDIRDAYSIYAIISNLRRILNSVYVGSSLTHPTIGVSISRGKVFAFRVENMAGGVITVKYID